MLQKFLPTTRVLIVEKEPLLALKCSFGDFTVLGEQHQIKHRKRKTDVGSRF